MVAIGQDFLRPAATAFAIDFMSMKTRSQHGSDNEISDGNPPTPPEITVDNSATAPVIASIEVDENSQAFTDALDRALLRLMGSRDDAAKVPAVYATGDIAARTDQPYSDQSSSRNPQPQHSNHVGVELEMI